jgi:hypothetical protein
MAPFSLFLLVERISCVRESAYALTVLHLWRSRDDLKRPSCLSLYCSSFCSSVVGGDAAHLEKNFSDSNMAGGSTRGSEKFDPAAWRLGFVWANDYFVHVVEAAGTGTVRPEMVGSLVTFAVHHYVPGELVHNDRSAHSRR